MTLATVPTAHHARELVCWGRLPVLSRMYVQAATSRLVATQSEVSDAHVAKLVEAMRGESVGTANIGAIDVAQIGTRLVIVDGHHRATAAIKLGWRRICVSIRRAHISPPSSNVEGPKTP